MARNDLTVSWTSAAGVGFCYLEVGLMLVIKVFGFWFLGSGMLGSGFFFGFGFGFVFVFVI